MVDEMKKRLCVIISLLALACSFNAAALRAAQKELTRRAPGTSPVLFEADEISFDEISHTVRAEGHVAVRFMGMTLNADSVVMDSRENVIRAYALDGKMIRAVRPDGALNGVYLEYRLNEEKGFLRDAEGRTRVYLGNLYIKGASAETAPPASARDWEWVHSKYLKKSAPDDAIVKWNDSTYTTCPLDEPHYSFKSKKAVLIPGRVAILFRPRLYIGRRYVLTLPFNLKIKQGPRSRSSFMIFPNYDDDKRYGLEGKYTTNWITGQLEVGGAIWTKGISEYDYRVDQRVTDWLSAYVGNNHHYDDDMKETKDRPFWGMTMERWGWGMDVGWAQREQRSVVKRIGTADYETTLWRRPEVAITAPWIGIHIGDYSQYFRFKGNWGSFQETGTYRRQYDGGFIDRYGWGVDYYTDYPFRAGAWTFSPFFKIDYWNYAYDNDRDDRHEITLATFGVRARVGIWEFGSAYTQRRTSGLSGFGYGWDYLADEDNFYQRVGVKLGPSLTFSLQAIVDMTDKPRDLTTLAYILTYDNSCCTRWELIWHEDKTAANDNNWMTLSFAVNAFTRVPFKFGSKSLENPFGRPGKLNPRRRTPYTPTMMERDGTLQAENGEIRVPVFDV